MSNHIVLREWGEVLPTELRTTVGGHMQVEKGSAWPVAAFSLLLWVLSRCVFSKTKV